MKSKSERRPLLISFFLSQFSPFFLSACCGCTMNRALSGASASSSAVPHVELGRSRSADVVMSSERASCRRRHRRHAASPLAAATVPASSASSASSASANDAAPRGFGPRTWEDPVAGTFVVSNSQARRRARKRQADRKKQKSSTPPKLSGEKKKKLSLNSLLDPHHPGPTQPLRPGPPRQLERDSPGIPGRRGLGALRQERALRAPEEALAALRPRDGVGARRGASGARGEARGGRVSERGREGRLAVGKERESDDAEAVCGREG